MRPERAESLSISNLAVFAAGDAAAQGPQLTPVAMPDAEVVARNLLGPQGIARVIAFLAGP
jgi:pyruvate/2-oxoglutarate dehydrogenase complex dihydrolipoamide dehydrogenase (E3) component